MSLFPHKNKASPKCYLFALLGSGPYGLTSLVSLKIPTLKIGIILNHGLCRSFVKCVTTFLCMLNCLPQIFRALALQVAARAKYSIGYDGSFPDLYLPNFENGTVNTATGGPVNTTSSARLPKKPWKLFMPNAYHPLLLQQHQESLHRAKRDVASATAVSFPVSTSFYYHSAKMCYILL